LLLLSRLGLRSGGRCCGVGRSTLGLHRRLILSVQLVLQRQNLPLLGSQRIFQRLDVGRGYGCRFFGFMLLLWSRRR
jgi:hypothetical protein